jgi:hypothetical protein
MTSLAIERRQEGKTLYLKLVGSIDEGADYSAADIKGVDRVIFDFEDIKLINSTGLQRWIKFLTSIPGSVAVSFRRCAIRVVTQINMFPGFLGNRQVAIESFFAPYFCEKCDSSCDILIETQKHIPDLSHPVAPNMQCPRCQGPVEFDGIAKKYFLFLSP